VDGTSRATEWQGYHAINETVHLINPSNGWLQNCNSTPFTVAGSNSPDPHQYPSYMAPDGENFRGINAVRVLNQEKAYTLDKLIKAGYDTRLAAFEVLIPALVKAFDNTVTPADSLFAYLAGPLAVLRNWDYRSSESSIATTLAVEWGQRILPAIFQVRQVEDEELDQVEKTKRFAATAAPAELLQPLLATILDLQKTYGRWQLPWGAINRFQRISPAIDLQFKDDQPSLPVGFTSSTWGEIPAYASKTFPGTSKRYGVHGNSFICAVEFGPKIRAKSLLAGGESGHPDSPNFADQSAMYARGEFKEVYYYKEEVLQHAVKTYHPGE
jgi:acyl-homoserine lactone acylase PvdQ